MKNNYGSSNELEDHIAEFEKLTSDEQEAIMNPGHVDEALWEKAKKASQKSVGEIRWPLVQYIYQKMGGK